LVDRDRAVRHASGRDSCAQPIRGEDGMTRVAVIAHRRKTVGGGLPELRRVLEERGVTDVFWREVGKSRFAPTEVRKALARKVDLVFVWGGDGMVQRCIDVLAGTEATV